MNRIHPWRWCAPAAAALIALGGCGDAKQAEESPPPSTAGKADTTEASGGSLSAGADDLTLWVRPTASVEQREGERVVLLRCTASRAVAAVSARIGDQAVGAARVLSQRTFEVALPAAGTRPLLAGAPLLLTIETHTGQHAAYTAHVTVTPRFYWFEGADAIWIGDALQPVYVADADPLRLRGAVTTPAEATRLLIQGSRQGLIWGRSGAGPQWPFDLEAADVLLAAEAPAEALQLRATLPQGALEQTAHLRLAVGSLALTVDPPPQAWPEAGCDAAVAACLAALPADAQDFASCGDYQAVERCRASGACVGTAPLPLTLRAVPSAVLDAARAAYDAGCHRTGSWCSLSRVSAYEHPQCLAAPPSIEEIVVALIDGDQDVYTYTRGELYGEATDRQGLQRTMVFGRGYSTGADQLLVAIDTYGADPALQAWVEVSEIPCHNCHEFWTLAVIWYPQTSKVVLVEGTHGYDS